MMKKISPFSTRGDTRAFTLLEVALIVAIIGMMLLMIVGYLFAPKQPDQLPPVAPPTLIPPSNPTTPAPKKSTPIAQPATPAPAVVTHEPEPEPKPAAATPAPPVAPAATPAPTQTIDLSPQSVPVFR
jgi:hypothetical protein